MRMATEKRLIDANDAEKFAREHILDASVEDTLTKEVQYNARWAE